MLPINKRTQRLIICFVIMILAGTRVQAQNTAPTWWFGVSGAANFNFFDGTTQRLNNSLIVPTAFHKGNGVRPYGSILMEYRPGNTWGFMLNLAYDGRGGKFDNVIAPCNCPATLSTELSYVAIEPSLRLGFKGTGFYFFAGPRIAFNVDKAFSYTELRQPNTNADFSAINNTIFSGQVGMGYDIMLSKATSTTWVSLSPFVSYHPYFGQDPRTIESMSLTTVRAGIALKFGKAHKAVVKIMPVAAVVPVPVHEFIFTARAPKPVLMQTQVSETLPLLNVIFFDEGSAQIPSRYVLLTSDQAAAFKEDQLQQSQSDGNNGRASAQLSLYHNVLNILGDRMRSNPGIAITLNGASAKGTQEGKQFAENVKRYLVSVFGIQGSRIATQGHLKPYPPSEHPGGTKELALLRAEDRRVDIETSSPELLAEVGGRMMKSVQVTNTQFDPLDSQVVMNVDSASQLLKSWSVVATDEQGNIKRYGPFTSDQASVQGASLLGNSPEGDYKLTMTGETNKGTTVSKEASVHLMRQTASVKKGYRYSIVFGFDRSATVASYNRFLTSVVAPLISEGSTVSIHGHTDIIGGEDHNQKLSESRAKDSQRVLEQALANSGRNHVKFETSGFGANAAQSPFENGLPEERFYNRTVIIDIDPMK
jgi:outer membrane protein OmpA-like peptidoglycan-associated protein